MEQLGVSKWNYVCMLLSSPHSQLRRNRLEGNSVVKDLFAWLVSTENIQVQNLSLCCSRRFRRTMRPPANAAKCHHFRQ
jgi:hypothetical protein